MTTCLSLQIVLRVPVAVVDNDRISCSQIYAHTTGFSAQKEYETIGIGFAVTINRSLTQVTTNPSIKSLVRVFPNSKEKL